MITALSIGQKMSMCFRTPRPSVGAAAEGINEHLAMGLEGTCRALRAHLTAIGPENTAAAWNWTREEYTRRRLYDLAAVRAAEGGDRHLEPVAHYPYIVACEANRLAVGWWSGDPREPTGPTWNQHISLHNVNPAAVASMWLIGWEFDGMCWWYGRRLLNEGRPVEIESILRWCDGWLHIEDLASLWGNSAMMRQPPRWLWDEHAHLALFARMPALVDIMKEYAVRELTRPEPNRTTR